MPESGWRLKPDAKIPQGKDREDEGVKTLRSFILHVLALLPLSFLLWYAISDYVAAPAYLLSGVILNVWLPDVVDEVTLRNGTMMVSTLFGEVNGAFIDAYIAGNQLAYPVDTRLQSYAIPFYVALHFAMRPKQGLSRLAWPLMILWLVLGLGLVATSAKNFMLGLGTTFLDLSAVPTADAIALAYQFFTIMAPALLPVVIWIYTFRGSTLLSSLLSAAANPAQAMD
ncbi:MAG: exosortase H-associated membrane protein [Pseudomonadota bacterium]